MTDLNAYLAQKRTALDRRRARIGRGEVGPMSLKAEATVAGRSGVRRIRVREHAVITDGLVGGRGRSDQRCGVAFWRRSPV